MITNKKLENFLDMPVELIDLYGKIYSGWFVKRGRVYSVLPFDWHESIFVFRASHIKSIMFLTNGVVVK